MSAVVPYFIAALTLCAWCHDLEIRLKRMENPFR